MTPSRIEAVVVGGGQGRRMGGERPKAFLLLGGAPLWLGSLRALVKAEAGIRRFILVVPSGFESEVEIRCRQEGLAAEAFQVVPGGARRQDSVLAGLGAVKEDTEIVLIHDAARPLVSGTVVRRVLDEVLVSGAAIPGVPVADTVKLMDDDHRVAKTLDRRKLMAVQTPQGFRLDVIRRAYATAWGDATSVTDDASLVEASGHSVVIVPGDPLNLKLTTPQDLRIAEFILLRE